ncbi:ubiquitin-like domain-containing protein [Streptomyces sp. NPDC026206]|uniref:ubiquitin-like domain-containing protein n=1 Tax=Streptomyces sp. NPDC026206 TaxID=3157089 RepID=UPI0033D642FB
MSHAQGSPHAAPRAATETPPPYEPYARHDPYGSHEPYARYEPYQTYEPPHELPYEAYEPFGQPQLPRQAATPARHADPHAGPYAGPPPHDGPRDGNPYAGPYEPPGPVDAGHAGGRDTGQEPGRAPGALPDTGGRAAARRAAAEDRRAADRRKRTTARERTEPLRRLLPQALVVAFLAGGTSAFIASDKSVQLSVDGRARTLHTFADDVEELLADEGMKVGEHDIVAPGPHHDLASGDRVIIRYGRPVALTLDGERRQVWTTARTVDGALRQLGVRAEGAYLSASRSARIGRQGFDLHVRTERSVTFMADGRERTVRTNAATVREAIEQAGITLRGQDTTSIDPGSFPREGQTISVMRITGGREVREEPIGFTTERREDPTLHQGTEAVVQRGEKGVERVTYELRTVNGVRQKPKRISSETVRQPRTEIVKVGTKARPTSVQGTDGLNWSGLAHCEAGGRPNAVDASGTYGGLYQFDVRTWHSLGGSGRPQDASAQEQTFRAKKLYISRGASPWPVCGRKLHG